LLTSETTRKNLNIYLVINDIKIKEPAQCPIRHACQALNKIGGKITEQAVKLAFFLK